VFFGLASVRSSFVERACAVRFSFFLSFRIAPTPGQPGGVRAWSGRVEMPSAALLFSLFFFFFVLWGGRGGGKRTSAAGHVRSGGSPCANQQH
jgi:hypothetical protein